MKSELMEKNYKMIKQNRFHGNVTSMLFKDGLRLNKRNLAAYESGSNINLVCLILLSFRLIFIYL